MDRHRFTNWLKHIYETQEQEISCSECFDQVSRFIDLELEGKEAPTIMPELKHHLDQCRACREEYEALREIRRLEDEGNLPSLDDLQNLLP